MKYHAKFIECYLDHLLIEEAKKGAEFVDWETNEAELNKKHKIIPEDLSYLRTP